MNKNLALVALTIILVIFGGAYFFKKPTSTKLPTAPAAQTQDPQEENAHAHISASEAERAKNQALIDKYTAAITNEAADANSYYQRALIYYKMQQYRLAIQDYSRVLNITPDSANAYFNRAQAFFAESMLDEAMKDYTEAATLKPDDARIFNSRGLLYAQKQDFDNALNDFQKAISLDPSYARAYYNRGLVYENQKKYKEAIQDYTASINYNKKDPEDEDNSSAQQRLIQSYLRRSAVYLEINDLQAAMKDANYIIELNPNFAKAYSLRALIYKAMGDNTSSSADESKASTLELDQALSSHN